MGDLIEPAPGAFEHRTFESGEDTGWYHGVFVLDPVSGLTDGYRVPTTDFVYYQGGDWIFADAGGEYDLLLHRATGRSWRWPAGQLRLLAASGGHLLVHDRRSLPAHRIALLNRRLGQVAAFTLHVERPGYLDARAYFSPDGSDIMLWAVGGNLYHVAVDTGVPRMLVEAGDWWFDRSYDGPGVRVVARPEDEGAPPARYFDWNGNALPRPACSPRDVPSVIWRSNDGTEWHRRVESGGGAPWTSPDGRYVAWPEGAPAAIKHGGWARLESPWPAVVVADAATCLPLFRVLSVRTFELAWEAEWLATGDGLVIGTHDGYGILRISPAPAIVPLPNGGEWLTTRDGSVVGTHEVADGTEWLATSEGLRVEALPGTARVWESGPEPAPTGDGRYFGYLWSVYDASDGRWIDPPIAPWGGPYRWGASYRERRFQPTDYWPSGVVSWLLLAPKIELAPFDAQIGFRVAGTGGCVHVREEPNTNSVILDCLPEGARVVFVQQGDAERADRVPPVPGRLSIVHPSLAGSVGAAWVFVRAEDGIEGWVSHDYLEHD